jgi:hypothetical protein
VDRAASDRLARRLRFRPVDITATLSETLELESLTTGTQRLRRVLAHPCGLKSSAEILGTQPAALLGTLEALDPQHQFRAGAGYVIARHYTLGSGSGDAAPLLSHGVVQVDGLLLTLTLPAVRGVAAQLTLVPGPGESLKLPEDLLAVLGWNWTRLVRSGEGWRSRLRLRGTRAARSARYRVWFRRAIPLLTLLALLGVVLSMAHYGLGRQSGLWILFFRLPTALIALSFCLQELPQYEIPPWPRRARATPWRR